MITIRTEFKDSLVNIGPVVIQLPAVPRVGDVIQDEGCVQYKVTRVLWIPFTRSIEPTQPQIELTVEKLPL
jgi:hypothetical protein